MKIPFEVPLDSDGYLRRQCPRCEQLFKWRPDEALRSDSSTEGRMYYCPYCGKPSSADQWWTDEQVDYARGLASIEAIRLVERELRPTADKLNRSSSLLKIELDARAVNPPAPLFEPDDMVAVEPPCHPDEPIKITEGWIAELHCLVCGRPFILPK